MPLFIDLVMIICAYIAKIVTVVLLLKSIKRQKLSGSIGYSGLLIAMIINGLNSI